MNEKHIQQVLEIEKKAQEIQEQAQREAQELPRIAEQEAQALPDLPREAHASQAAHAGVLRGARHADQLSRTLPPPGRKSSGRLRIFLSPSRYRARIYG